MDLKYQSFPNPSALIESMIADINELPAELRMLAIEQINEGVRSKLRAEIFALRKKSEYLEDVLAGRAEKTTVV